jgi:peptidoglycan lytic transglycosylase
MLLILPILFLNFCAPSSKFSSKKSSRKTTNVRDGEVIVGYASYYADKFHGRLTANGETFNMHDYTAAHRNLPFGTVLLVTNLENGKKVKVRVNDRGPFVKGRILDLSPQAAKDIGLIKNGVAKVNIKILKLGINE